MFVLSVSLTDGDDENVDARGSDDAAHFSRRVDALVPAGESFVLES